MFSLAAGRDDGSSGLDATGRRGVDEGERACLVLVYISDKKEAVPTSRSRPTLSRTLALPQPIPGWGLAAATPHLGWLAWTYLDVPSQCFLACSTSCTRTCPSRRPDEREARATQKIRQSPCAAEGRSQSVRARTYITVRTCAEPMLWPSSLPHAPDKPIPLRRNAITKTAPQAH